VNVACALFGMAVGVFVGMRINRARYRGLEAANGFVAIFTAHDREMRRMAESLEMRWDY
jgi:hypothetical protein